MSYTNGLDNPELYFQTKLYTGNGGTQSITLDGSENMQPDWVWIKCRSAVEGHSLFDSVRGVQKSINSDTTSTEAASSNYLTAFGTDGFSVGSSGLVNANSETYVSWNWKAGGSASSNSDGSITSSVSANTTAGFSIVSWTGTGSATTLGHSLGAIPKWYLVKNRSTGSTSWRTYHTSIGATKFMALEENYAEASASSVFNNTEPTSSVFSVGTDTGANNSGDSLIAYVFAEKKGYSKFGSYTGNGNADGTFVYTGFKPAWIVLKNVSNAQNWYMYDNKRSDFNLSNDHIYADLNNAETADSSHGIDILSNCFKIRTSNDGWNGSGENYIYMAFAESPFVTSTGIPTTAR